MADGTRLNENTTTGDLISTDDISDGGVADGQKVQRVKVGHGADGSFGDVAVTNPLGVTPDIMTLAAVSGGAVSGHATLNKFGQNPDANGGGPEDIWDGGGTYQFRTAAAQCELVSSSALDNVVGGTGAQRVQVYGLDASYNEINEQVNVTGTTPNPTANSYLRITRIVVTHAGSLGQNVGNLTLRDVGGGGDDQAIVLAGNNQTLMAIYTVPAGKTLYVSTMLASAYNATAKGYAEIEFRVRNVDEVFALKANVGLATDGSTSFQRNYYIPLKVPAKADIKMRSIVSANNNLIIGAFDGILVG